eukprot:jgi/Phyca11/536832/estExt2_fgenesh1_pg.C_PHYCAscaffold_650005
MMVHVTNVKFIMMPKMLCSHGRVNDDASLARKPVAVKEEVERQTFAAGSLHNITKNKVAGIKREVVKKEGQDVPLTPKKKAKKTVKKERVPRKEPDGWKEILRGIKEMRAKKDAEVDRCSLMRASCLTYADSMC